MRYLLLLAGLVSGCSLYNSQCDVFVDEACLMSGHVLDVRIRLENKQSRPLYLLHTDGDVPELDLRMYDSNCCEIELLTEGVNSIVNHEWLGEIPACSSRNVILKYVIPCNDFSNDGLEVCVRNPFCSGEMVKGPVMCCNRQRPDLARHKGLRIRRKPLQDEEIRRRKESLMGVEDKGRNRAITCELCTKYLLEVQKDNVIGK